MSLHANSDTFKHNIDLKYWSKMRSSSLKWSLVNGLVLLLFVYDLSRPCGAPLSALQWCEGALAAVAAANLALHAARALRPRDTHAPRDPRTPRDPRAPRDSYTPRPTRESEEASSREEALSLSLSPRAWRPAESPPSPHSSPHPSPHSSPHPSPHPSPHSSPHSPPSPRSARVSHDRFIADRHALENYLREYEARRGAEGEGREEAGQAAARGGPPTPGWPPTPAGPRGAPAPYQLAATDAEGEESGGGGAGGGGGGAGGAEGACVWRRLHLDPRRLAQYNFNLRLWIQVTIVQRLVRELERVERALSPPEPIEDMSVERLRSVAGGVAAYVEPWADVRHVVRRWRAWARAPALSAWRGDAPAAAAASPQRPSDADLLLHLVATYLDGQLADAAHPRPFSAAHLCVGAGEGEAGPPPHPRRLALQRRGARWALLAGEAALEVGAGRNAPLHALLLLLAAAARRTPPALHTTHLGPAGLNMLWIIGR